MVLVLVVMAVPTIANAATCIKGGSVRLDWVPNPETDIQGYNVYRCIDDPNGLFVKISGTTPIGNPIYDGDSNIVKIYWVDVSLPDGEYTPYYKLSAVDECGNESVLSLPSAGEVRFDNVAPGAPVAPIESAVVTP